jgi:hypothetical protein
LPFLLLCAAAAEPLAEGCPAASTGTCTVRTTDDTGAGSFRDCLTRVNAGEFGAGATVDFAVAGQSVGPGDPWTKPKLPTIHWTGGVDVTRSCTTIDGADPSTGEPTVALSGGDRYAVLRVSGATHVVIRGIAVVHGVSFA